MLRGGRGGARSAHAVELLVDLGIVFVVLDELDDECAVCEGKELCVDLHGEGGECARGVS